MDFLASVRSKRLKIEKHEAQLYSRKLRMKDRKLDKYETPLHIRVREHRLPGCANSQRDMSIARPNLLHF